MSTYECSHFRTEFVADSPLEGTGFELPVRGCDESSFHPFCVAPDCLFAFCLRRILRVLESIERGRQREVRIIDVGPDGINPATCELCPVYTAPVDLDFATALKRRTVMSFG